jgi:hypothetical protein
MSQHIHLVVEIIGWWFLASLIGAGVWSWMMRHNS